MKTYLKVCCGAALLMALAAFSGCQSTEPGAQPASPPQEQQSAPQQQPQTAPY